MSNIHEHQSGQPSRLESSNSNVVSKDSAETKLPFFTTKLYLKNSDDSNKENQPAKPWISHSDFQSSRNITISPYQKIHEIQTFDTNDQKATLYSTDSSKNDSAFQQKKVIASLSKSTLLDKLTMLKEDYSRPSEEVFSFNNIISKDKNNDELYVDKKQSETFSSKEKSNLSLISEFISNPSNNLPHSTFPSTVRFQSQKAEGRSRLNFITPKDKINTKAISADSKPKKRNTLIVGTKNASAPLRPIFINSDRSFLHHYQPPISNSKKVEESEEQYSTSRAMTSYSSMPHCQFSPSFDTLPPIVQKLQRAAAILPKFPMRAEPGSYDSKESDDDDDDHQGSYLESECKDLVNNKNIANNHPILSKLNTLNQDDTGNIKHIEQKQEILAQISGNPSCIQKDLQICNIEKKIPVQNDCKMNRKIVTFSEDNKNIHDPVSKNSNVQAMASTSQEDFPAKCNSHLLIKEKSHPVEMKSRANKIITVNKKNYLKLNILGKGGSSKVYLVYDEEEKQLLAIKKVRLMGADPPIIEGYKNEISLLCKLQQCDRVIKLFDYEYCSSDKEILVVMEKGDTDLATALKSVTASEHLTPVMIKFYWSEMLKAVREIHEQGIIHSDLKPANFLLVSGKLKLIDFGISSSVQKDKTSVIKDCQAGTINFMPPEALQGVCHPYDPNKKSTQGETIKINRKADIWSLGCILYNLVYGKTPFQHIPNLINKLQAIINPNHMIEFPQIEDTALLNVLKSCLIRDPNQRPSIDDLLKDPYLKSDGYTGNTPVSARLTSILHQMQQLTPRSLDKVTKYAIHLKNLRKSKDT